LAALLCWAVSGVGSAAAAQPFNEPTAVLTLSYERADQARLFVDLVSSRGNRFPFEATDCQNTSRMTVDWVIPASLLDTLGRYEAGPHEIRLSAVPCGPGVESLQTDPLVPYRVVVETYQAGATAPETSRSWEGAIDALTGMGAQDVAAGQIPVIIPDETVVTLPVGPEVEGSIYQGEIDADSITAWDWAGPAGEVIIAIVLANQIEIAIAEDGRVGMEFVVQVNLLAASGCSSQDDWTGTGLPGETLDGSDPAVIRATTALTRANDCGEGLPSGDAVVSFSLPVEGTTTGTIEVGGGTFPFSAVGPPLTVPTAPEPSTAEEPVEVTAAEADQGGSTDSGEVPSATDEDEQAAAPPNQVATTEGGDTATVDVAEGLREIDALLAEGLREIDDLLDEPGEDFMILLFFLALLVLLTGSTILVRLLWRPRRPLSRTSYTPAVPARPRGSAPRTSIPAVRQVRLDTSPLETPDPSGSGFILESDGLPPGRYLVGVEPERDGWYAIYNTDFTRLGNVPADCVPEAPLDDTTLGRIRKSARWWQWWRK
jgi:hypothetical protein